MCRVILAGYPSSGNRFFKSFLSKMGIKVSYPTDVNKRGSMTVNMHETFMLNDHAEKGIKVIHLVRNPRDAIISRINNNHGRDPLLIKKFNIPDSLNDEQYYAVAWKHFTESGIKGRGNSNYLEVRYEDVCLKPKETMKKICKFLNIEYKEEFKIIINDIQPSLGKGEQLHEENREFIDNEVKELAIKLGYEDELEK